VTWCQQTTNRKGPSVVPMVTWPITSRDIYGSKKLLTQLLFTLNISVMVRDRDNGWPTVVPMVTWPMTSHDPKGSRSWPRNVWGTISQQLCEIVTWCQQNANTKGPSCDPSYFLCSPWWLRLKTLSCLLIKMELNTSFTLLCLCLWKLHNNMA